MLVGRVQRHCRSSLSKVSYLISDLNDTDVLVAEFRGSIKFAIPKIMSLLSDSELNVRIAGVDAFSKLSEQGKVSNF